LGFKKIFVSKYNRKGAGKPNGIEVFFAAKIEEMLPELFKQNG
jgi:hypothetical protein